MPARPFIDTMRDIRSGDLLDELGDKLNQLVDACNYTNKNGTLTLTLTIKPDEKTGTAVIIDDVKTKTPKEITATLFHITPEHNLSLRNPRQPDIPNLEPVKGDKVIEPSKPSTKNMENS